MNASGDSAANSENFHLDIFGQEPRINRLYTQLTFCYPLTSNDFTKVQSEIIHTLTGGLELLSAAFPWIAGKVVNENGSFMIKLMEKKTPRLVVKDLRHDTSVSNWETLQQAKFPFSMLDESIFAPCKTLAVKDAFASELPVFLVQASFISGGLLLTFNAQHGSMDMTGQAQIIRLLAKACRKETFSLSELSIGNMDRRNIIPLLDDNTPIPEQDHQIPRDSWKGGGYQQTQPQFPSPTCIWAYFIFPATSLAALKSVVLETTPSDSFASTDDVLTAFIWQNITRSRLPRFSTHSKTPDSTLSRNVDVRRYLSIPPTYPGLVTSSTLHSSAIDILVKESLGHIAVRLRSALDPAALRQQTCAAATAINNRQSRDNARFAASSVPELDIRLSSWAKENCFDLDFGFGFGVGKPEAVRRPQFIDGAREGLVYYLPKTPTGEITVGICLRNEDLERLKADEEFVKFGTFVG